MKTVTLSGPRCATGGRPPQNQYCLKVNKSAALFQTEERTGRLRLGTCRICVWNKNHFLEFADAGKDL
jgi:hypothetical protein